ncbi:GCN5-Like N-Acetyltransferase [Agrobacterium tumefaciens]|uniref:GNAT family N-acetyltransferase n=1 Tax=Agrobacterium tumefaciens TaxID=358 RepID=UPI001ADB31D2|nr:GNAT family N-acetyltransferase [Agrobacterium tumefaciens]QTK81953.1 GCN5-Like N-Acetyltransferase [Agrobacterium tumefaciens]
MEIRPFSPTELDPIQEIRAKAFAPIFSSFREIVGEALAGPAFGNADEEQRRYLDKVLRSADETVFVAHLCGRAVGFIHLEMDIERDVGKVGLNAVDPGFGRQGVGTLMYRFAIDFFRSAGLKVAKVSTGGDSSHAAARRAYEKAGFNSAIPTVTLYQRLQ